MYRNNNHTTIQQIKALFYGYLDSLGDIVTQAVSPVNNQLEIALANTNNASFKILHPLLIQSYRMPNARFADTALNCVGLDIETDHLTGEPKLLGLYYPNGTYYHIYNPTLTSLYKLIHNLTANAMQQQLVVWGNLDIQCLIRMFSPTEDERKRISRGISANIRRGKIVGSPPVIRDMSTNKWFYVSHYIAGRSLKLGCLDGKYESSCWIFNISQFYPGMIADTAKGLGLDWTDFPKDTHLIDWGRFSQDVLYRKTVLDSNKQDARIVAELVTQLQTRFYNVFACYPTLLVSTGSLADTAVSKLLTNGSSDYQSNNWQWLAHNVGWDRDVVKQAETLLAEAYSAGYVDQFAVGYFDNVCMADISAAYPHKIRALPDLREAILVSGADNLDTDLDVLLAKGYIVESAIIRGRATIPTTLKYHPITLKTYNRENYRPTGIFFAAYTLEERAYCLKYGATFDREEYVIICLRNKRPAPIAKVSDTLGAMRDTILQELATLDKIPANMDRRRLLEGQQLMVKLVDNSGYGKTVMTVAVVEDIDGKPEITGYTAGDRFNLLYGALITARTRVQIAEACMFIEHNGGVPIMVMTDSIYWQGTIDQLPMSLFAPIKTAGFFEPAIQLDEFYLLKTGQYEYRTDSIWHYKLRGLNVTFEQLHGDESFYRQIIKEYCNDPERAGLKLHPKDISIPIDTRRLISIGSHNLEHLGMIEDGITLLKPFVMSSKQAERYIYNWQECLDSHIWLQTPHINPTSDDHSSFTYPLTFLREQYEHNISERLNRSYMANAASNRKTTHRIRLQKMLYCTEAMYQTGMAAPPDAYKLSWASLEAWFGVPSQKYIAMRIYQAPTGQYKVFSTLEAGETE